MTSYIATFFTHYDAMLFRSSAKELDIPATLAPVPRSLSSSCGTCAKLETEADVSPLLDLEYEQFFRGDAQGCWRTLRDRR